MLLFISLNANHFNWLAIVVEIIDRALCTFFFIEIINTSLFLIIIYLKSY